MNLQLGIFLVLTLAHAGPALATSIVQHRRAPDRGTTFRRSLGTIWIYVTFLGCWVVAAERLYRDPAPTGWTIAGLAVFALGTTVRAVSLRALLGSYSAGVVLYDDHRLVTRGPYAWVRHPLHLGLVLQAAGMAAVAPGWITILLAVALTLYLCARGRLEDRLMRERFGAEAEDYQCRVPSMLPLGRFSRRRPIPGPDEE